MRPPLRIAIDASPLQEAQATGMRRYTELLIAGLLDVDREDRFALLLTGPSEAVPKEAARLVRRLRFPVRVFERLAGSPEIELAAGPVDVFHCQSAFYPAFRYGPLVVTLQDVIPLTARDAESAGYREALRTWLRHQLEQATLVIAPSRAAAADFTAELDMPEEKARIVPHAPDPRYLRPQGPDDRQRARARSKLKGPYVLATGIHRPHKNHVGLVRGFARIARDVPHALAIAGGYHASTDDIRDAIRACGLQDRVHLLGHVRDEDLPALTAEADLFVQPSLLEGFGLPVLDAMAAGTPVACSSASALPEVAGDAAEYFDPRDEESIGAALARVLSSDERRAALSAAGRERAACYSWQSTARQAVAVYHEAAARYAGEV